MFRLKDLLMSEYDGAAGSGVPVTQGYNPEATTNESMQATPFIYTAGGAIKFLAALGNPAQVTAKGLVVLNGTGVLAMTLALPTAIVDDGKTVDVLDVTGHAHTITTPANGINGGHTVITMTGAIGNMVTLKAWNGSWYFVSGSGTITT